jgi:hypothetical protein
MPAPELGPDEVTLVPKDALTAEQLKVKLNGTEKRANTVVAIYNGERQLVLELSGEALPRLTIVKESPLVQSM